MVLYYKCKICNNIIDEFSSEYLSSVNICLSCATRNDSKQIEADNNIIMGREAGGSAARLAI